MNYEGSLSEKIFLNLSLAVNLIKLTQTILPMEKISIFFCGLMKNFRMKFVLNSTSTTYLLKYWFLLWRCWESKKKINVGEILKSTKCWCSWNYLLEKILKIYIFVFVYYSETSYYWISTKHFKVTRKIIRGNSI